MSQILPSQDELLAHAAAEPAFAAWLQGHGPLQHSAETRAAVFRTAHQLVQAGLQPDLASVYHLFRALDRLTASALRIVAHMTYARRIRLDGEPLQADDFKRQPEGHTGGALNMVPAYAGYLALNALTGRTRGWLMGQGHCVAAIDALNVLTGNLHPEQERAYAGGEEGLNRLLQDFYGYAQAPNGAPAAPLGSHVNPHTAGGIAEGGYLGFAELQYAHMPLPGETLVAFLSDGAAEEQRGSDWIPRWWRAEDCGAALPVMIANGRRIEQRTGAGHPRGPGGLQAAPAPLRLRPDQLRWARPGRLRLYALGNGAAPGAAGAGEEQRDPPLPPADSLRYRRDGQGLRFPWRRQQRRAQPAAAGQPARRRACPAVVQPACPASWVEPEALELARRLFIELRGERPLERDNPLAMRHPIEPIIPPLRYRDDACSPMAALDRFYTELVEANPDLRARVGNPDELASNRLGGVLKALRHRVSEPESELESVSGKVITALNEEAVVSACLANQGGLNLVASYEAFCVKMLGAVRQSLIFARQQKEVGRPAGWLGWPLVATSHTWENGKNQQSHQDTTFCEALLGEMSDMVRVLFPADHNSALALLPTIYRSRGQLACLVIPKRDRPMVFDADQAERLARDGAILVEERCGSDPLLLIANGSYRNRTDAPRGAAPGRGRAGLPAGLPAGAGTLPRAARSLGGRGGGRRGAGGAAVPR